MVLYVKHIRKYIYRSIGIPWYLNTNTTNLFFFEKIHDLWLENIYLTFSHIIYCLCFAMYMNSRNGLYFDILCYTRISTNNISNKELLFNRNLSLNVLVLMLNVQCYSKKDVYLLSLLLILCILFKGFLVRCVLHENLMLSQYDISLDYSFATINKIGTFLSLLVFSIHNTNM